MRSSTNTNASRGLRDAAPKGKPKTAHPAQIVVDNRPTSRVSDADVRLMVAAANALMPDLAAAWSVAAPTVLFLADMKTLGKSPDKDAWLFHLIDEDPSAPGALAYHSEDSDLVDGFVLTKTILENGGVSLYDPHNPAAPSVASALFHELAEALIDPTCNIWWMNNANGILYCAEVCDPVESNAVLVKVKAPDKSTVVVALSDFVYPAWRDPEAPTDGSAQMNHNRTLKEPFSLDKGGYYVKFDPVSDSEPQAVFGHAVPAWKRALKQKSRRIARRQGGR